MSVSAFWCYRESSAYDEDEKREEELETESRKNSLSSVLLAVADCTRSC